MATNYTPIVDGVDDVDAADVNSRLTELDDAIEDVKDGTAALASPDVTSFVNSAHDHEDAAGGGQLTADAIDSEAATAGQVLTADGASGASFSTDSATATVTTKGDLLTRSAAALARLPVGTDGHVVIADSAQALGIKWAGPLAEIAEGAYTGDGAGAGAGQAIAGVGFQPDVVFIYHRDTPGDYTFIFTDDTTTGAGSGLDSLDADGFTVNDLNSDSEPNTNGEEYIYVCFKLTTS